MDKENNNQNGKKNNRLLMILSIITLISIIFFILTHVFMCCRDDFKKEIKIVQNGTTIENMEIRSLAMHPGENLVYQVHFKSTISGNYEIAMDFNEKQDGGLKEFIVVSIKDGDNQIINKKLSEVFEGDTIKFNCKITAYQAYVINIKYEIPITVGNEAMFKYSSFDIKFVIDMVW